jgi:hypothetical protein
LLLAGVAVLAVLLARRPTRAAARVSAAALLGCGVAAFAVHLPRRGVDLALPLAALAIGALLLGFSRTRRAGGRPRWLLRLALAPAPALLLAGLVVTLHELGDVVALRTVDERGSLRETRLLVVDHEGSAYVAAGSGGKRWLARLAREPRIEIVRGGVASCAVAVPVDEARTREAVLRALDASHPVSRLSAALGHRLFYRSGDAPEQAAIAIRLDPCGPAGEPPASGP